MDESYDLTELATAARLDLIDRWQDEPNADVRRPVRVGQG